MKFNSAQRSWFWIALLVSFVLVAVTKAPLKMGVATGAAENVSAAELPILLGRSFLRMLSAYFLSIVFGMATGTLAATNPNRARVLLPILDVLQSIPILGFFPTVLVWFVGQGGGQIGLEFSAIFLIFTSMVWNLSFCVYDSIKSIPHETLEAANSMGFGSMERFRQLYVPAAFPRLVDNSVLSWSNGWYFLMACEIIALGPMSFSLPGIGSYLSNTIESKQWGLLVLGLLGLIVLILTLDLFVWRPLQELSKLFTFESSSRQVGGKTWSRSVLDFYKNSDKFVFFRKFLSFLYDLWRRLDALFERPSGRGYQKTTGFRTLRITGIVFFWTVVCFFIVYTVFKISMSFRSDWEIGPLSIALAVIYSSVRILVAYIICLIIILPIVFFIHRNSELMRKTIMMCQVLASIPATAFFPLIILVALTLFKKEEAACLFLLMTGMLWYLAFNIMGGAFKIPNDILEASDSLGLKGTTYLKKVFLPAILPATITGSLTAIGGGWNALIISEYFQYGGQIYHMNGVGALIAKATYESGNEILLMRSLFFMVSFIVLLNHFVWQRLYRWVEQRFRMEG